MPTAKSSCQRWIKLLPLLAIAAVSLLILFSGLEGHTASSHASAEPPVNPPPARISVASSATISVCKTDVVLILDRSGSMEFDTVCYGCWEVADEEGYDYDEWESGDAYRRPDGQRGGVAHPLAYPHDLCVGSTQWITQGSYAYIIFEAEHYTQTWPTFDPEYHTRRSSYWGLQRNGKRSSAVGDDPARCDGVTGEKAGCGGYMQHNPWRYIDAKQVYTTEDCPPSSAEGVPNCYTQAPQLTYHFRVPGADTYDVWLRAQGGSTTHFGVSPALVHWGIDGAYEGSSTGFQTGGNYHGAESDNWRWVRVGDFTLDSGWNITHALTLWAGGSGFRVDKMAITDAPAWAADDVLCGGSCSGDYWSRGPDATVRRDGYACWACNPLYGQPAEGSYCEGVWNANPQWPVMYEAMFDDQQPIRTVKEAGKYFVGRADARHHQIGVVGFSTDSTIASELGCIKRLGDACANLDSLLGVIEFIDSGGNTNTGSAMWDGIRVQMNGQEGAPGPGNLFRVAGWQHYGRPGVRRAMILITDGVPTANPSDIDCPDVWPGGGEDYDCAVFFAEQARQQGIVLYTVGLGRAVDEALLSHMADVTGGAYFPAPDKKDVDDIIYRISQQLLHNCSLTLGIGKTVTPTHITGGQPFTYTIAVSSTGTVSAASPFMSASPLSATRVLIQDALPEGTTFITASGLFSPAHPLAGVTMTWDMGTLPHDGTPVSVTLVLSTATTMNTLTNTATAQCHWGLSASDSVTVTVLQPQPPVWSFFLPVILKECEPGTWWPQETQGR